MATFRAVVLLMVTIVGTTAYAQDDLERARTLAGSGQRPQAITLLREHLQKGADADAQLLLGIYLSWEGDYDQARTELEAVLRGNPRYLDAISALMNVELWSGHPDRALELARQGLAAAPDDDRFLNGRRRASDLRDRRQGWSASLSHNVDWFSDGRSSWRESTASIRRGTIAGSFIFSGSRASRFGLSDSAVTIESYPPLWRGAYGYAAAAFASEHTLYPESRYAVDIYQSLGHGVEVSGGVRHLNFSESTTIYVATVSKYLGNWLVGGRMFYVPDAAGQNSRSFHGSVRRYFGAQGTSYLGARFGHGFARTEIRDINDFEMLNSDTVAVELSADVGRRFFFSASGSTSRQERVDRTNLRQDSLSVGFGYKF